MVDTVFTIHTRNRQYLYLHKMAFFGPEINAGNKGGWDSKDSSATFSRGMLSQSDCDPDAFGLPGCLLLPRVENEI